MEQKNTKNKNWTTRRLRQQGREEKQFDAFEDSIDLTITPTKHT